MPESPSGELPARSVTARTILLLALMASIVLGTAPYLYVDVSLRIGHRIGPEDLFPSSLIGAIGLVATAAATAAIVAVMRRRADRHGGLVPLPTDGAGRTVDLLVARVDEIASVLGVEGRFLLRAAPLDPRVAAHVRWGRSRRPMVVLSGGLLRAHATEPAMVDAILAHELAHVRNRDVVPTTIVIAAWRATLVFGVLPTVGLLAIHTTNWYVRSSALVLIGLVYLVRLEVLRSREFWADVRAGDADFRPGLIAVLTHGRSTRRSWSPFHPARRARVATLTAHDLSVRVLSFGEALLAGTTIGVVLTAHLTFWQNLLPTLVGPVPAALAGSYLPLLPVMPFLLVIARGAGSRRARWSVLRGTITLLALAGGVSLGSWIALGLKTTSLAGSMSWLGVIPNPAIEGWAPVIGLGAFLVISTLAIGWCRCVVALWVDTARTTRRARIAVEASVILYGALLFSFLQLVVNTLVAVPDGWAKADALYAEGVRNAARAPWDVVPGWGREIDTGGFAGLFDYLDALVVGPVALAVPLLAVLRHHRRRRRVIGVFLAGVLAVVILNNALAVGILAGIDSLAAPARAQLPQNVHDLLLFVETVAALLVAVGLGLRRRPVVVAACSGAALATAVLAMTMATRPLRCVLSPVSAGVCESGLPPQTLAQIALFKIAPTLLCCVGAAVAGRLLSLLVPGRPTRSTGSLPTPRDPEPLDGGLTPAEVLTPRASSRT